MFQAFVATDKMKHQTHEIFHVPKPVANKDNLKC